MTGKESVRSWVPTMMAVAASTAWLVFCGLYLRRLGRDVLLLTPGQAAELFAGVGAPLAVLWLALAVFEQRRRLGVLSQGLRDVAVQHRHALQIAETQTRALVAFQGQAERQQAADSRALALQDMAASVAVLAERLGVIRREDIDLTWARFGSGDVAAFVHPFLAYAVSHPEIAERLAAAVARDPLAAAALQAYVRRYERLTATADDKLVRDVIEEGPLGRAFRLFKPAADAQGAPAAASGVDDDALARQLTSLSARLDAAVTG